MKKSEGLFKLLYLKQSLLHQLKKPVLPSLWVLLLCKAGRMEQKGVGLKWGVRMKRLYEAITDQLLGWTWVSLSCFDWSAVAVLWGKCCQQCFGEREASARQRILPGAWPAPRPRPCPAFPLPPPVLVCTAGATKGGDLQTLCTGGTGVFLNTWSLGLICN